MEPGEETVNGTAVCLYPNYDPGTPSCLVAERPPDVWVHNRGNETRNVTFRVVRNGSTIVFEETATAYPGTGPIFVDVLSRPGNYTLNASLNGRVKDVDQWRVGERYVGRGEREWDVLILDGPEIKLEQPPSQ
jgi:hypothetical protein